MNYPPESEYVHYSELDAEIIREVRQKIEESKQRQAELKSVFHWYMISFCIGWAAIIVSIILVHLYNK